MPDRVRLTVLFEQVRVRVDALREQHPGWPCARGCDGCCRRLARVPEIARTEWQLLRGALRRLPTTRRETVRLRAEAWARRVAAGDETGPHVCPFLDDAAGACTVYDARPLFCRSYGYYRSHHHDAWCGRVTDHVIALENRLVFGNHDALERDLHALDPDCRSLLTWLADDSSGE